MENSPKKIFSAKRALMFAGILILVCTGGIILFSRRLQPGKLVPGETISIPVVKDTNQTQSPTGTPDTYGLDIKLSNGQSQPQTVQVLPLVSGEPLSPAEIGSILARLPALLLNPGDQSEFNLPKEI